MRILLAAAAIVGLVLLHGFSAPLAWVTLAMLFVYIVNTRREGKLNAEQGPSEECEESGIAAPGTSAG